MKTNQNKQPKTKRPATKRIAKNVPKKASYATPTTLDTITKKLSNIGKATKPKRMNPYAECRLMPWASNRSPSFQGLPDGANGRKIVVDHVGVSDFSVTSGGGILRIFAGLPYGALFQPTASTVYTLNDSVLGLNNGTFGTTSTNAWVPTAVYPAYKTQATTTPYTVNLGPYAQTKARCIGAAWRLIYAGTVTNAAGIVSVRDFPFTMDSYASLPSGGLSIVNYNNSATTASTAAVSIGTLDFPTGSAVTGELSQTSMYRSEDNVWGLLKHNQQIYNWNSYFEQGFMLIPSTYTTAQIANAATTPLQSLTTNVFGTTFDGQVNFVSDEYNMAEIILPTAPASGLQFRLEVKTCWEYQVQPQSPIYALTKQSATPNPNIMRIVEEVIDRKSVV